MIRAALRRIRGEVRRLRLGRVPTRLFGARHRRSRTRVELDITWACDLRCANCNRSCGHAPTGESMTVGQVRAFVDESLARGVRWERIRVLGGEPTLHPELHAILAELDRYRRAEPSVVVELATHGHGERTRRVLASLPSWLQVDDSHKSGPAPSFEPFNIAPIDTDLRDADFRNGCPITTVCGIGLGPNGYFPCAVAAGIDRVLGSGGGRPSLPAPGDDLLDQLDRYCRMCGHFDPRARALVTEPVLSPAWQDAYAKWRSTRAGAR